jgi:hypothetical protein
MIGETRRHRRREQDLSSAPLSASHSSAQLMVIVVGEEVTFSATIPEPYVIVSHHTALQCMVMCD